MPRRPSPEPLSRPVIRKLVRWFERHQRDLPWRRTRDPYAIWVSEILLQQTQVETVRPYFLRFLAAFPTVEALAAAPLDAVLKAWEGCGYYARARHLHQAARRVVAAGQGLPRTAAQWRTLPGIGAYTAAAIASIASGEPAAVVDGNVKRVLSRVLCEDRDITQTATLNRIQAAADAIMAEAALAQLAPGSVNQGLIEIGATICLPRRAHCQLCPLAAECCATQTLEDVTLLPVKAPAKAIPHFDIGAAIIGRAGKLLITQRPHEGLLGGLWEFPGGKRDPGETLEECVAREIREELALDIDVGDLFAKVKHAYTHFRITLYAYRCTVRAGRIRKLGVADYRWVTPAELSDYAFPKADRVIIALLQQDGRLL